MSETLLSVCIIMKNEEKVIDRCLRSLSGIADEIIVVDTGSTDNSKTLALEYADKVYDFEWVDDFSKARNYAASKANGEWILVVDADEYIDRDSFIEFKKKLIDSPPPYNIIALQIVSFLGESGQTTSMNYHSRLYRNDINIYFDRKIHEMLVHKDKSKARHGSLGFQIFHSGYMSENIKEKNKTDRNLNLLLSLKDKTAIDYYFIGNEYKSLDNYKKAVSYYQKSYSFKPDLNLDWVKKMLLYLVDSLNQDGRIEETFEVLDACMEAYPTVVDFLYYKGILDFKCKNYSAAKKVFNDILLQKDKLVTDSSDDFLGYLPLRFLGEIYELENELKKAVKSYSQALSLNPSDDQLWIKLITILAKETSLEELASFLNNNMVNRSTMSPLRVAQILLATSNLDVQKLSRSLLNEELTQSQHDALLVKNLFLDGSSEETLNYFLQRDGDQAIKILTTGLFSIVDFILLALKKEENKLIKFLYNLKYDQPLTNLYKLLFGKNIVNKLSSIEENLFIKIFKQAHILNDQLIVNRLTEKRAFLSNSSRKEILKVINDFDFEV